MFKLLAEWKDDHMTKDEIDENIKPLLENTFKQNLQKFIEEFNSLEFVEPTDLHLIVRAMAYQHIEATQTIEAQESYLRYIMRDEPK